MQAERQWDLLVLPVKAIPFVVHPSNSLTHMTSDEERASRYTTGLFRRPSTQEPNQVDGDPQYAALVAYLTSKADIGTNGHIFDVGAGRGVLARAISEVNWTNGAPWYVAVDRSEPLDALNLPTAVHNHSRKAHFEQFLNQEIQPFAGHAIIVLRNILHELDISTTASLLAAINAMEAGGIEVLIQDMEDLKDAESGNAPWSLERITGLLESLDMKPRAQRFTGRSGTRWFHMVAGSNRKLTDEHSIGLQVAAARSLQRDDLKLELASLGSDPDTLRREIVIPRDRNTLQLQLETWKSQLTSSSENSHHLELVPGTRLVLRGGTRGAFLTQAGGVPGIQETEVLGTLRSKDAIDMASTVNSAQSRVWFWGYSNKRIVDEINALAVSQAVLRGVDVRVLIADPGAPVAVARSMVSAYSTPARLIEDIQSTLVRCDEWSSTRAWADVRTTATPPPASYVVVDDVCVMSQYTSFLTGSASPSLILGKLDDASSIGGVLRAEFEIAFNNAVPLRSPNDWS